MPERIDACCHTEQIAAAFERSAASAVGEEPELMDANQAARQYVQQEAAQQLMS